jgi:hypothetical protein
MTTPFSGALFHAAPLPVVGSERDVEESTGRRLNLRLRQPHRDDAHPDGKEDVQPGDRAEELHGDPLQNGHDTPSLP